MAHTAGALGEVFFFGCCWLEKWSFQDVLEAFPTLGALKRVGLWFVEKEAYYRAIAGNTWKRRFLRKNVSY